MKSSSDRHQIALQFSPDEGVRLGVRRIVKAHIITLRNAFTVDPVCSDSLQEIRRGFQQLRSLLYLIRWEIGNGRFRLEDCQLKAARQFFSEANDGVAKVNVLSCLAKEFGESSVLKCLIQHFLAERDRQLTRASDHFVEAELILNDFSKRMQYWELDESSFPPIIKAVGRTYRYGRDELREYLKFPNEEKMLSIRERVACLLCQIYLSQYCLNRSSVRVIKAAERANELIEWALDCLMTEASLFGASKESGCVDILLDVERMKGVALEKAKGSLIRLYKESPANFLRRIS